ncbi:hypothetical protein [uncultured Pseudacidovorax sp.]|uniref:hypothetical protein n=1 Tax=uncultured Pseudacidovorax sp. TaxID=679313 RepID=UPI0025E5DCE0|nr:hypothetical protein [uncultured Pseudacidovorax sp.]
MQLHQITVEYIAAEDRLLMHLSTTAGERLSLWLTRRLLLALHAPLHQAVSRAHVAAEWGTVPLPEGAADLLAESARAQALRDADFDTPAQPAPPGVAAGAIPVVTEVTLSVPTGAEAAGHLSIRWRIGDGRDVDLNVPAATATALQTLLLQAAERGGWGLPAAPAPNETARTQGASGPSFIN